MNEKPVLIIMAAGMGSRYGSLKQLDQLDEHGNVMMDYALYDAYAAGFRRVNVKLETSFLLIHSKDIKG